MTEERQKGELVASFVEAMLNANGESRGVEQAPEMPECVGKWLACAGRLLVAGAYPFEAVLRVLEWDVDTDLDGGLQRMVDIIFHFLAAHLTTDSMHRCNAWLSNQLTHDEHGADPFLNSRRNAAHFRALLTHGLDPNAIRTGLMHLPEHDRDRIDRYTRENDEDIDARQMTPVNLRPFFRKFNLLSHAICFMEASKVEEEVMLLLEHGANVNSYICGLVPALSAVAFGLPTEAEFRADNPYYRVTNILLEKGANPQHKSNFELENISEELQEKPASFVISSPDVFVLTAMMGKSSLLSFLMAVIGCEPVTLLRDMKSILSSGELSLEWRGDRFWQEIYDVIQAILPFSGRLRHGIEGLCLDILKLLSNHTDGNSASNQHIVGHQSRDSSWSLLQFGKVDTLQSMSRVTVYRQVLASGSRNEFMESKINRLPVPWSLKDFLRFNYK